MVTKQRFVQGMTFQEYLGQMTTNKDKFTEALAAPRVTPEERAMFAAGTRSSTSSFSPRTGAGTR
jgi:hypothetical protein